MNGFELKDKLLESDALYYKSTPIVFWSTQASVDQINKSNDLRGNGLLIKSGPISNLKASLTIIMEYGFRSRVPLD
jgi:hypothetical protein